MEYTMKSISGLSGIGRERLGKILRNTRGVITVSDAADILGIPNSRASKMLSKWTEKGWLSRVRRGVYVPIPVDSSSAEIQLEDPWTVIDKIYAPCYIGGLSAAEYWDLTEQIYNTVFVMTTQRNIDRETTLKGTKVKLRTIKEKDIFGLKTVWRGSARVSVSDPSRTLLDMINSPDKVGGGIRPVTDIFKCYLEKEKSDISTLIKYAAQLSNGAVFKRLGFLLESYAPEKKQEIDICSTSMTKGRAKLDPGLNCSRIITKWNLWVPENWK